MMKDNILLYQDYREYLRDYYEKMKKADETFSYKDWAKQLAPERRRSFARVLTGEMLPTRRAAKRIALFFKFSERETRYFQYLVGNQRFKETNFNPFRLYKQLTFKN